MLKIPSVITPNNKLWGAFEVLDEDVILVDGPSGSGKSLYLNSLLELYVNKEIFIGYKLSYLPQTCNTFVGSVLENITLFQNFDNKIILKLLNDVGLSHIELDLELLDYGKPLSGGELQRLLVVRALIYKPSIIIADEITSGLDDKMANIVHDLLVEHCELLIYTAHNGSIKSKCDKILQCTPL